MLRTVVPLLIAKYILKREVTSNSCNVNSSTLLLIEGTQWRSWLRHCATTRNAAGSIPDGVTGIFH
jgi:hypothetical protein